MNEAYFNRHVSHGFKPLRCYGNSKYNLKKDPSKRRKQAKQPFDTGYTDDNFKPLTLDQAKEWEEKENGWIGWLLPNGKVALDIEDKDSIFLYRGINTKYQITPPENQTPNGIHGIFNDPYNTSGATRKETRLGFMATYRAGGSNILILPDTEGRTWTVPLNGNFPDLPEEFRQWEENNPDHVLNALAWNIGKEYRHGLLQGYEDIDCGFISYQIDHGMTDDQIQRSIELIFLQDFDWKRTQEMIDRARGRKETGQKIIGAGTFVKAIKDRDLSDILSYMRQFERLTGNQKQSKEKSEIPKKTLRAITIGDFLSWGFPARENIVDPWLPTQGLIMVYGYRGIGKTFFIIGLALAVSSGDKFLKWLASKPFSVLHIDGEMPAVIVQERYAKLISSQEKEPVAQLKIITPDLQSFGMPNIAHPEGQAMIEEHLEGIDLVIVDNISTLCRYGRENETESWYPIQEWGLRLRSQRKSVVFVHHAGKGGFQRGTSSREDVLDTVINLKRPADYTPDHGARFEVHFEKARNVHGDDVNPFEARLETHGDNLIWTLKDIEASLTDRIVDLLKEGIPQQEIADILNISKGTVSKHKYKAKQEGKWSG